jgi:aerobic carbon-monoxide dehydrogenase medium subunit
MKPPPFRYHAPDTLEEALALLAEYGDDARPLAGGQSLVPVLNFRLANPAVLVDLNRIETLAGIADGGTSILIGAMTRQRTVERSALVADRAPLVNEAMQHVAHPQIRNRGTFGGSLAHADPAAELPTVMLASGARLRLRSRLRERWLTADEFFLGLFTTALETGELLVEIEIPAREPRTGYAFEEVSRRHGDFALFGVAVNLRVDESGVCTAAQIVCVNPGAGAERATRAAGALIGRRIDEAATREAARLTSEELTPTSDVHASSAYRLQLARVLTARAIARAITRFAPARSAP